MPLLGVNWHNVGVQSVNINSGGAAIGGFFQQVTHSLQTTPDLVLPLLRSVSGAASHLMMAGPLQIGGNASACSIGFVLGSSVSLPLIAYDVFAVYVWSGAR